MKNDWPAEKEETKGSRGGGSMVGEQIIEPGSRVLLQMGTGPVVTLDKIERSVVR